MESVAFYGDRQQLRRNLVISLVFVVIAVFMIAGAQALVGLLVFVVFAAVAVLNGVRLRNPKPLLTLTEGGLRPRSGGLAPWHDIEDVGIGMLSRAGVVGVRLSDYTAYVRSVELAPPWKRVDAWFAAILMPRPPEGSLPNFTGSQKNLVALLAWNRKKTGGLDMCWPDRLLPKPSGSVVTQILEYRTNALNPGTDG
jgi:hypothetical protein